MKITAQDVFTALYEAFRKLQTISPLEQPELTASKVEVQAYNESLVTAQTEVEKTLKEGSELFDKYVDGRVRAMIQKMIRNGDLK